MRKAAVLCPVLVFLLVLGISADLCAKGTSGEAKAMVEKAVAYLKAQGKEKAFAEFDVASPGPFRKGDLYVFVLDMNADILAHGARRKMIGKGSLDWTDPDGKLFLKEIVEVAKSKEVGWVSYRWTKPSSKKISQKVTYFQRVNDVVVCCGSYVN
jgi:signal transduction histidine kinase